MHQRAN